MNIQRSGAKLLGVIALGVLPLTLAGPAFAETHTAKLTAGPVALAGAPVEVCLDSTCTSTTPLVDVTLTAEATTDTSVTPVTLTKIGCPDGGLGVGIQISSAGSAAATVTVTATGTGLDGQPKSYVVGPKNVTVDVPGVVASACTTS